MCLDAHAHGMRVEHEIFKTPNAVTPTLETRDTPSDYGGEIASPTMPMWRVQTEGYLEGAGQLIGVVSGDKGFLDSPDTEWLSGGVNSKGPKAVALGRHANFFHWGFAASPSYLTDEAKLVFVNAVHYIAKFDGVKPVGRKVEGSATRETVLSLLEGITDEGYARRLKSHEEFVQARAKEKAELEKRKAAGEELTEWELQMLSWPASEPPERLKYAKRYFPSLPWDELGDDVAKIDALIRAKLPYVYNDGRYILAVDEELEAFGVGNGDPAFLEKAIAALDGDQGERALALLGRYTEQDFTLAADWRAWLKATEGHRFFTEAGGYKWLVDTNALNAKARAVEAATPTR